MKTQPAELLKRGLTLATCFLMIAAAAIVRDGRILGHDLTSAPQAETPTPAASTETMRTEADGTLVVNTTSLSSDVMGYAGPVPLEIRIREGVVQSVTALDNDETPGFMNRATALLDRWNGLSLEEASALQVDAVSGATFTSRAIVQNMQAGLLYASQQLPAGQKPWWKQADLSPSTLAGLAVALMAALLPLWVKNRTYRLVQQVLNVAVLGFWCGAALSYASLLAFMSNGMNLLVMLLPAVLLTTAFVYPLFGKKSYYCNHLCPYGSAQELAARVPVGFRLKMSPQTVKRLDTFRQALWAALMFFLWTGLWASWVDYEPFSAFIVQSASWFVIALAVVFLALSLVTPRPYCRFVCPLGSLFKQ